MLRLLGNVCIGSLETGDLNLEGNNGELVFICIFLLLELGQLRKLRLGLDGLQWFSGFLGFSLLIFAKEVFNTAGFVQKHHFVYILEKVKVLILNNNKKKLNDVWGDV